MGIYRYFRVAFWACLFSFSTEIPLKFQLESVKLAPTAFQVTFATDLYIIFILWIKFPYWDHSELVKELLSISFKFVWNLSNVFFLLSFLREHHVVLKFNNSLVLVNFILMYYIYIYIYIHTYKILLLRYLTYHYLRIYVLEIIWKLELNTANVDGSGCGFTFDQDFFDD